MKKQFIFTKKEVKRILEMAIFCSSGDACANWTDKDYEKMMQLAENIKKEDPSIKIKKIEIDTSIPLDNYQLAHRGKKLLK